MPAAHSPPMPRPNSARSANSIAYDVEKPHSAANTENQMIDSVSGSLRPYLSAIVPAMVPPTSRIISVMVPSRPARAPIDGEALLNVDDDEGEDVEVERIDDPAEKDCPERAPLGWRDIADGDIGDRAGST